MRLSDNISIEANIWMVMRERGKIVPGSHREGHNVFTTNGKNWLAKLIAWQTISGTDIAYTNRRVRWMGVGIGSQLESATVTKLAQPTLATSTDYIRPIQTVEYPNSTTARFIKEFGTSEITIAGVPVVVSEAALLADVSPANNGAFDDVSYDPIGLPSATMLNPTSGNNSVIAYKAFDGLSKTVDFTLEVRWDFRFV
jgi:hypothetical protein